MSVKITESEFLKAMEEYHGPVLTQTASGFTADEYAKKIQKSTNMARVLIRQAVADGKIEAIGYRLVNYSGKTVRIKAYDVVKKKGKLVG